MGHKENNSEKDNNLHGQTLGVVDVVIGAVVFYGLAIGLKALLDVAVPGLFKEETLREVLVAGAIFLGFWAIVGNFLLRPFIELSFEREERTAGDEKRAAERIKAARDLQDRIDAELVSARLEGIRARDKLIFEAKARAQALLDESQGKTDREFAEEKDLIEQRKLLAKKELPVEVVRLSEEVVARLLTPGAQQAIH